MESAQDINHLALPDNSGVIGGQGKNADMHRSCCPHRAGDRQPENL